MPVTVTTGVAKAFSRAADSAERPSASRQQWVRDDHHAKLITLMVWALVVIMIVPGGFNYVALTDAPLDAYQGDPYTRVLWLLLLGGGFIAVAWRFSLATVFLRSLNIFLMLFVMLALCSTLWSIAPQVTVVRNMRVITFMLVAAAFVLVAWEPRRFQNVLKPIITLMLAGSILFGLIDPALAIHQETVGIAGDWHGLAAHKNGLGALAGLGLVFWVHAWLARENRRITIVACIAVAAACLLLSHSSTALVAAVFAILFMIMLLRTPQDMVGYLPYIVGIVVVLVLLYALAILKVIPGLHSLLDPIISITGKDSTFTGRTDIWAIIAEHIKLHPVLGTGYGAYWTGPTPNSPSYAFVGLMHFYPGSAHNGYIEIINDLGYVGLICLIGYLLVYVRQCLKLLGIQREQMALYLTLFIQQSLTNLTESHWLDVISVNCFIMTLATFCIARSMLDLRLLQRYGSPKFVDPNTIRPATTTANGDEATG